MPSNKLPIFQEKPSPAGISFIDTDGTTAKIIYTAGENGALIDNISVVSDDTVALVFDLTFYDGTTDFPLGAVSVPAGAGSDGAVPSFNLLNDTMLTWLQSGGGAPLGANNLLKIAPQVAVTAAKTVTMVAFGGNY